MQSDLYTIPFQRADGGTTSLGEHAGKVLLVVNVASRCGLTPQYDGLQALYAKYQDRGLMIVGFPANEFGAQEPGSDEEIQQFCRLNYGVDFPVYAKIVVKGPGQHPLYHRLIESQPQAERAGGIRGVIVAAIGGIRESKGGGKGGEITWNFEKFVLDRSGQVAARFAPDVKPDDPRLIDTVESELAKPVPAEIPRS